MSSALTALLSSDVPTPLPSWFFHLYVARHLRFNLSRAKVSPLCKSSTIPVFFIKVIKVNSNSIYPLDRVKNVESSLPPLPCSCGHTGAAGFTSVSPGSAVFSPTCSAASLAQVPIATPPDYCEISQPFPKLEFLPSDGPFSIQQLMQLLKNTNWIMAVPSVDLPMASLCLKIK